MTRSHAFGTALSLAVILLTSCGPGASTSDGTAAATTTDPSASTTNVPSGIACGQGFTNCSGSCVSTSSDNANCGACSRACASGETCSAAACTSPPPATPTCSYSYGDWSACQPNGTQSRAVTGKTPDTCTGLPVTIQSCTYTPACPSGTTSCSGVCVSTATDRYHCGGCGKICGGDATCDAGQCKRPCETGAALCGGTCVYTNGDVFHCGSCGHACGANEICEGGNCRPRSCPTGMELCGGLCVDIARDTSNCGLCGRTCPINPTGSPSDPYGGRVPCDRGICLPRPFGFPCDEAGQAYCGAPLQNLDPSLCKNVLSDWWNCGSCGHQCNDGDVCRSGTCVNVCTPPNNWLCGSSCVDLNTNPAHCGVCWQACAPGRSCVAGICQ